MKKLLALLVVLSFPTAVLAEDQATLPPLPKGPIPAVLDFAKWKVTIKVDERAAAAGAAPVAPTPPIADAGVTIVVTKTKNLRKLDIHYDSGASVTAYVISGIQYAQDANGAWTPMSGNTACPIYSGSDFPEWGWASSKNYVAVAQAGGRPCFVFSDRVSTLAKTDEAMAAYLAEGKGQPFDPKQYMAQAKGMIDMQSLLPVTLHQNDLNYSYLYESAPGEMIVLPGELTRRIQTQQGLMKDLSRKPASS